MDNLSLTISSVITALLISILVFLFSISLNVKRIEASLMNTTFIECQCREVPDGN